METDPAPASAAALTLDPVRTVLLGLNFGQGILRHLERDVTACRLVGLCDQNQPKARRLAEEFGLEQFPDLDAALRDDRVEAVALFSGPARRAELVGRIIGAGRDVITTKPFGMDPDSTAAVLERAGELGRVIHLNSPAPEPAADLRVIEQWRSAHNLGRPVALCARTWVRYREQADGSWYDDVNLCPVAPMLRLGIYFLNDFVPLLGPVERVMTEDSRIFTGRPTSDHAHALLRHAGGATSSLLTSFCVEDGLPYQDEVVLNFERGTIRRWIVRRPGPDMSQDHAQLELQAPGQSLHAHTPPGCYAGWYQWESFQRAVRHRLGTPREYAAQIVGGIRLFRSVALSAASGRPEPV